MYRVLIGQKSSITVFDSKMCDRRWSYKILGYINSSAHPNLILMSCDLDNISEEVAFQLYSKRYCLIMENGLQVVNKFLSVKHDVNILQCVFTLLLTQFSLSFDELQKFFDKFVVIFNFIEGQPICLYSAQLQQKWL